MEKLIFLGIFLCSVTIIYFSVKVITAIIKLIHAVITLITCRKEIKLYGESLLSEVQKGFVFTDANKQSKGTLISLKTAKENKKK